MKARAESELTGQFLSVETECDWPNWPPWCTVSWKSEKMKYDSSIAVGRAVGEAEARGGRHEPCL